MKGSCPYDFFVTELQIYNYSNIENNKIRYYLDISVHPDWENNKRNQRVNVSIFLLDTKIGFLERL